jgi:hypothetical protein
MHQFIKITDEDGKTRYVNPAHIHHVSINEMFALEVVVTFGDHDLRLSGKEARQMLAWLNARSSTPSIAMLEMAVTA